MIWASIISFQHIILVFEQICECPLSVTGYTVDVVIWNKDERWGYITVKLHGDDGKEAVATIDQ